MQDKFFGPKVVIFDKEKAKVESYTGQIKHTYIDPFISFTISLNFT
jgi:hypothetical protein